MKKHNIRIKTIDIFRKMREGVNFRNSLISYGRFKFDVKTNPPAIEWQHRLYINLWLVEVYIDWIINEPL